MEPTPCLLRETAPGGANPWLLRRWSQPPGWCVVAREVKHPDVSGRGVFRPRDGDSVVAAAQDNVMWRACLVADESRVGLVAAEAPHRRWSMPEPRSDGPSWPSPNSASGQRV